MQDLDYIIEQFQPHLNARDSKALTDALNSLRPEFSRDLCWYYDNWLKHFSSQAFYKTLLTMVVDLTSIRSKSQRTRTYNMYLRCALYDLVVEGLPVLIGSNITAHVIYRAIEAPVWYDPEH